MNDIVLALIVDGKVQAKFKIPEGTKYAMLHDITELAEIELGAKFNPDTKSFYSDVSDKPE